MGEVTATGHLGTIGLWLGKSWLTKNTGRMYGTRCASYLHADCIGALAAAFSNISLSVDCPDPVPPDMCEFQNGDRVELYELSLLLVDLLIVDWHLKLCKRTTFHVGFTLGLGYSRVNLNVIDVGPR